MQQLDGLRPARLKVGIISAGRVGSASRGAGTRRPRVVAATARSDDLPPLRRRPRRAVQPSQTRTFLR
nr:hypothetical protein [Mycolicibacterium insubricum]